MKLKLCSVQKNLQIWLYFGNGQRHKHSSLYTCVVCQIYQLLLKFKIGITCSKLLPLGVKCYLTFVNITIKVLFQLVTHLIHLKKSQIYIYIYREFRKVPVSRHEVIPTKSANESSMTDEMVMHLAGIIWSSGSSWCLFGINPSEVWCNLLGWKELIVLYN